jgi:hypothetical protein
VRDLQGALPLPASGLKPGQGGAQVVHPVHQNRAFTLDVIGQEDQREPGVTWTAATLVPIASMAKTTRPPSTSVKYTRSVATSRLGVYRKSSC